MNTPARLRSAAQACAVSACIAVLLLATSPPMGMVWDEGDTIARAEQIARLRTSPSPLVGEGGERSEPGEGDAPEQENRLANRLPLTRPPQAGTLSRQGRGTHEQQQGGWPYTTVREGHPPLVGMLVALGMRVAPAGLDPLTQARLGPMLLFALAAGALFHRLDRDYGTPAVSWTAVAALVTMPRLFAHAHYATLDGPLTACWLLAWATFRPAVRDGRFIPLFAAMLGLTMLSKFTGWLAPLPFAAWSVIYRDRRAGIALAAAMPLAIAVFVLANPPLWHEPLAGMREFFDLNLDRAARPQHNISTQFFGRMYNLDYPLPWYNTLVWTAITVSPLVLLLGAVGIVASVRHWRGDEAGVLLVLQWATLVVVRALPWAPPHDGERLILPSFAFLAALAGVGAGRLLLGKQFGSRDRSPAPVWARIAVALALAVAAFDTARCFPYGLSYYSHLVGGLRGAVALGMEPTYYWDALDCDALDWLAENTADDEKVAFAAAPPRNLEWLHRHGQLKRLPGGPGKFRWYVLQRRPSAWQACDRWLLEHGQPRMQRTLHGVPLLDVYDYELLEMGIAATK